MLSEWSVGHFKSMGEPVPLRMAPITLFAGANSSGKSTILQSILLLKQTIQYGSGSRALSLNGPLLRLGTFDDLIHTASIEKRIVTSFKMEIPALVVYPGASWLSPLRRFGSGSNQGFIQKIEGSFSWSPKNLSTDGEEAEIFDKLQSTLQYGQLVVQRGGKESESPILSSIEYGAVSIALGDQSGPLYSHAPLYARLDSASDAEIRRGRPESKVVGAYINHFLPSVVQVQYNATKQYAQEMASAICARRSALIIDQEYTSEIVPWHVLEIINQWLVQHERAEFFPTEDDPAYVSTLNELISSAAFRQPLAGFGGPPADLQSLQEQIENAFLEDEAPRFEIDYEKPRTLDVASEFLRTFFKSGIRYLGPLRDEPRPVYPLEALENTTDVGYRGEHTAAVLDLNSTNRISYYDTEGFTTQGLAPKRRAASLKDAVVDWLRYLGVAADVRTTDAGVFGNQLRVTTVGLDKFHDLTNVGVGVSQVLPIVVSALLAPSSSILIFEQPELHLHPRVQARLADFFLSVALSGKQCIVETHSEYMVERLRRRIAEADDDDYRSMIQIYFTQRLNGETICQPINITEFGAILNWPPDFFDQSEAETGAILEAAAAKRKRRKSTPQQ